MTWLSRSASVAPLNASSGTAATDDDVIENKEQASSFTSDASGSELVTGLGTAEDVVQSHGLTSGTLHEIFGKPDGSKLDYGILFRRQVEFTIFAIKICIGGVVCTLLGFLGSFIVELTLNNSDANLIEYVTRRRPSSPHIAILTPLSIIYYISLSFSFSWGNRIERMLIIRCVLACTMWGCLIYTIKTYRDPSFVEDPAILICSLIAWSLSLIRYCKKFTIMRFAKSCLTPLISAVLLSYPAVYTSLDAIITREGLRVLEIFVIGLIMPIFQVLVRLTSERTARALNKRAHHGRVLSQSQRIYRFLNLETVLIVPARVVLLTSSSYTAFVIAALSNFGVDILELYTFMYLRRKVKGITKESVSVLMVHLEISEKIATLEAAVFVFCLPGSTPSLTLSKMFFLLIQSLIADIVKDSIGWNHGYHFCEVRPARLPLLPMLSLMCVQALVNLQMWHASLAPQK